MIDKIFEQFKGSDLKAITGMDATFLYAETPTSPMHIGSVAIIEGSLEFEKISGDDPLPLTHHSKPAQTADLRTAQY